LLGEVYGISKQLLGSEINVDTIAKGEQAAADVAGAASGFLAAKTKTSPPKEIHALRESFEQTLEAIGA
jgi:hypothetical protein